MADWTGNDFLASLSLIGMLATESLKIAADGRGGERHDASSLEAAGCQVTPETYEALRRLASQYLRGERAGHTLQPTALLHEALFRVLKQPDDSWRDEAHVVAFAARAMRRILISYGIARARDKRGGPDATRLPLDEALKFSGDRGLDLHAVDEAIEELARVDPRQAQIVELRFFGGLTIEEIGATLGLSPATVKREWSTAKLWLRAELTNWGIV